MVTLVVETGAGLSTANSYATAAEGDTYHGKHLYTDAWDDADNEEKEKALMMATRILDDEIQWQGRKVRDSNALEWPRYNMKDRSGYLIGGNEIPQRLTDATCEMARWLLTKDRTAETDDRGYKKMALSGMSLEIDKTDRTGILPKVVSRMLAPFGAPRYSMSVPLVRI